MQCIAGSVVGTGIPEHFHLGELMDAVDSASCSASGPCFGSEAMRKAGIFEWQRADVESFIFLDATKGNFGGGNEAQISFGDGINLSLVSAGAEADAFEHGIAGEVGCREEREAFPAEF